jgi:hypothetical protein
MAGPVAGIGGLELGARPPQQHRSRGCRQLTDADPGQEGVEVLRPVGCLQLEAVEQPVAHRLGDGRVQLVGRRQGLAAVPLDGGHGHPARGEPVAGGRQAVDVGGRTEPGLAAVLLQRGVAGRDHLGHAHRLLRVEVPGEAEVDQHDASVLGEHDVRRVEVAVEHPRHVHRAQRCSHAPGHVEHLVLGERLAARPHHVDEGPGVEPLHHEVGGALLFEHLVDPHHARVGEPGERLRLAQEAIAGGAEGRAGLGRHQHHAALADSSLREQLLDRHAPPQPIVARLVGDAEAAPSDHPEHVVAAARQGRARRELGRCGELPPAPRARQPVGLDALAAVRAPVARMTVRALALIHWRAGYGLR